MDLFQVVTDPLAVRFALRSHRNSSLHKAVSFPVNLTSLWMGNFYLLTIDCKPTIAHKPSSNSLQLEKKKNTDAVHFMVRTQLFVSTGPLVSSIDWLEIRCQCP